MLVAVAGRTTAGAGPDAELRRADAAMYVAKNGGRNRIHHATAEWEEVRPTAGR